MNGSFGKWFVVCRERVVRVSGKAKSGALRISRHRPSPAMIVALIALCFSMTTGTYAALKVAKNSVGPAQLKNGAVTAPKLKNLSISKRTIQAGAVGSSAIGSGAITESELAAGSVGGEALQNDSVDASKLADGSVSEGKLGVDSVKASKLAPDAVTSSKLAPDAVTSSKLAPGSVQPQAMATFPAARLLMTTATESTLTGTSKVVPYSTVMFDTASLFAGSAGKMVAPITGIYSYDVSATFASNPNGLRYLRLWRLKSSDGSGAVIGGHEVAANSTGPTPLRASGTVLLSAGDSITPYVIQQSGVGLDLIRDTDNVPGFSLSYIARAGT